MLFVFFVTCAYADVALALFSFVCVRWGEITITCTIGGYACEDVRRLKGWKCVGSNSG